MNHFLQQAVSILAGLVLLVSSTVSSLPEKFHDFTSKFAYKPPVTSQPQKKTAQNQKTSPSVLAATVDRSKTGVTFTIPAFFKDLVTLGSSLEVNGPSTFNDTVTLTNQDLDLGTGELTASNVLYGLTAGKGILISEGQTPEIKLDLNVVSSISGRTGDVSLEEGDGISVDGLEIANTDKGSAQNIFKTFSVSGQSDIVAGSNSDKLTVAAGSGIVLTTDASNKILTITSGLSTGWIDDGTNVRLTDSGDNVGIGTSTPGYKLDVAGDANLASGYAFKINGADVLTGTALGTGVTASSLTSLGTLGNVTVTGASALNGGITFDNSTDTISAFTAGGTINLANNLITNVGNAGTDFTASGGLTLAGLLTASSGVSLDSETVTDFSGNGIVVTSNSLFVNLTTSSNTGATSSNSGLEVGTGGLTLLKGCSDGELLKYTDAGGWACSADIDTTSGSTSGFTDFGNIVALITSADNLGVGTSSPTNKLSVLGNADISGNLGVGTTSPAFKLDVVGSTNLSAGNTYKINGTDVLSGSALGVGVTSSSLTQLGTLGNLTVTGAIVGNGGLTLAAGQALNVNSDAITDLTGNGIVLSGGTLTVGLTSSGTTGSSSSNSGLEVGSGGLTLLKGCADNELLKYTDASGWACAIDIDTTGANLAGFTDFGSIVALTTTADNLGVGTSSPTNKLSVVGNADISGNLGIGVTTPAFKLDIAGSTNLSSGSTYKINGTDVLTGSALGVGVTSSSLTSLGTLGNLTVTGTSALNGGISFDSSTDTISAFTAGGTINMATNIITDIGNSGTDFTGAGGLNLAGLLTALSGVSINSETVTDFSGSGITVSSNALAVNLTSSGTTGSTSSNSGLEVGSGGLTLLKGCTDGELLKYTDAGGWACSTDSNTGNVSGFTDFGSIVALTTTADNLGVGTSSPTNKLSVVGTADISGNLGVGTTTPAFKLDVAGSTNLSSGSTYKINGTDVLSGTALGVGVTASSLTSVGTLGNLTVTGAIVGNGGLTLATGQTFTMNGDAFTDLTGSGIIISGNALTIGLTTSGTTGSTSSNSGLEVGSAGLTLLKGCTDGELLKYTDASGWACANDIDTDTNSAGFTDFGSIVALTTTADSVGIGTSSPANKLSVVGNADVSGNFGIGTTNPGYKLDVAGSANLSTGSTYKINGTDVLSGTTLGSGITASSLTSVGTLTNLGVGNSGSFGGGLLVGGETLNDFTGNGVTLSSGALTLNLTSSGTSGSTSSNSGLEVGSAGLTLLKGCTDGELLKYTDAGGWACATDSNSGNVSGFTDFGSIVALTTTADNLGVGTSSPTNKLSVVGNADISGNLGVGTTTPAFKLDVAGSANLSSGSTYKINGTDVLSASGLGVGVTASSLTSLGTLGNLTVTGAIVGNGGLTLATGQTFTINGDAFTDLTGNGIVVSGNALTIGLTSSGTTGSTSSNSGLEVGSGGLTLLKGCTDGELLKYTDAGGWACSTDSNTGNVSGFTDFGSIVALTTTADNLGVGTSSPTNKLSVVGNADISGNLGVGTTTPGYKLDVAGNVNISTGSTYKINGTDVLSVNTLGSGVTTSSLTSVGTLTNLGVGNSGSFGGGLLVGGRTLTNFTGNGVTLSSGALTVNLTSSGTTGSTSSNSGLEVGSGGLTLLKGCTDGEILKYTDAGGWACATDTDTDTNTSGFTDFGSIVALTTTADNLGVGTSSPTNKLSVVGNADISGNLGVGTTTPAFKLDVAGSTNLSSGSTYKINGADVLSGSALGVGVTASSLTSVGTLGNLTVTGAIVGNGGLTLATGQTFTVNGDAFTDLTGNGIVVSGNALTIGLTSSGTTGSTSSNSGLEVGSGGLTLLKGCTDGELLKYTDASGWACAADTDTNTGNISGFTDFGSIVALTTTADSVGIGTSSPANKLSVVGNADVSGNFGIGTTNPGYKLDVAGSANISSGSTYKIAGTDVLSGNTLGAGITASSLTSVGTLTNLGVGNSGAFGGGLLVGGRTLTNFTGNGVTLSSGALTVALTSSGTTGSTSSNSGLEVGSGGLTLLKGCTDGEILKYTDASGWACAADTDTDTNTSGFTDFGSIVALTTTADNLGVGTSSPANKLSVVGNADVSGNLGVGTTTPGYKLDVAGSANLSSGSTYKINGTDVLTGSGLGVGVTASSLTSLGTLGNLTVAGTSALNGGITFDSATDTISAFTLAGAIDAATNLITNIGNAGTDFIAGGGLNLAGVFTANSTTALNGATTLGDSAADTVTSTAGVWSFTNATTVDLADSSRGALNFEGGLLALDTLNSRIGIGTTTPTTTLDVVGTGKFSGLLTASSGVSINSETVTDFSGNGIAVTANALGVNLTSSGTTGSTSSNSGLEVGSAGLTLLKGCTDGELLKYTDASGWACAADTDTNTGNISGFTDFGSIVALTTTADNLGVGTSSPTNKLSVVGTADISGNLGIGTTTPGYKLDVVGSVNLSTGSTYKINGTDVLSGTTLGSGVTASSLTSVGTLTNLGVGNSGSFGGGLLVGGQTLTNFTGNGVTLSSGALTVNLTSSGTTGSTSSNSGLEVGSGGLTLLKGCTDGEILKYTDASGWACAADVDNDTNSSGFTDFGSIVALTTTADNLGVGTSSPTNKLSVVGTADISGNLGVGTTTPAYKLEIIGTGRLSGLLTASAGVSINSETVTDFSGSGIAVTGNALTVNLATSGTTGSTSSSSGLEVGAGGLTLLKGCNDGEILKYTDAGGWACVADVDNDTNNSGFTDFGSIVALTTTADSVGIGTSSPANKLSVVGNADVSGSFGIGTTAPAYNLEVIGTGRVSGLLTASSGVSINGETVTDLSGSGIVLTSNALTVNLTSSGNTGSTSSNSGLEVGSGGLTLLKGCSDGEILKYTDAGGWACAADVDNDTNSSGFTDFGSIVAMTTSADNLGVGTSSPTNKLSVLGNADISGNLGVGTTTPAFKLDVAGSANLSTGSTYKINGTDVLSGSGLGVGVTASSLTSLGTLGNLTVAGTSALNGGITFDSATDTISAFTAGGTIDLATNLITNIGNAGTDFVAGGGLTLAGAFTANSTAALNAAVTLGDNVADTVTSNAGVWSFTNATTVDLADSSRQALNFESGLFNLDTLNGRIGIGTTTPTQKLDVVGNVNVSSGSTYKIAGTDVLSGNTLGAGITASSLTSVGTLTNLGVGNSGSFGGGLLVGGETLTDFTGNGVTLSSGALTVALTSSGTTGSTSSNSGLEVGSAGLTLLKGCTDGELLKYTDASGWACATDTDTNTGNVSGFTDFGSIVALTTSADNLGVGTSSPTNKLSVVGTADISGNLGVGTTTPAYKLDVVGSANLSTGSTYKINGTDVLSASGLGVGVTASSLTSLGTLGNLTVAGTSALNGGITFDSSTDTISAFTAGGTIDLATNLITNIGNAGTDFIAGGGLTLAGAFTANSTTALNGATTLGDAAADTVTSNAGVWSFTNATTVDLADNARGALNFEGGLLALDTLNSRIGIGTTTPTQKLDVVGNVNVSSGSTYKIAGTDVLSGSTLGSGVTASSLTSVGTLTNLGVGNSGSFGGGILVGGETLTDFTGNGVTLSSGALTVNLTSSGTTGSTSSNSGLEVGSAGLTLLKGCTDGELLKYTDASGWACATDTDTNTGNISGFTDFGSIVALTTTADNLGVGTSSPTNKLSVVGTADISGNLGIGTTTPGYKLDVVGSANLSSGSTYKINGTDVLSASGLGVGVTASSLTSLGTLGNLTVAGTSALNGGITFDSSTDTISAFTAGGTIDLATNLITNIGNAGTDFIAGGGLTLAGAFTANSTAALNGATTLGDAAADTVTSNAGVWSFTNATTVDLADSSRGALNFEGGLLALDTINGRIGIGTTTPTQKLDVVGNVNVSSGSTYKIAGTDVLSGNTLGAGITASSLTSVGTLTNLGVGNSGSFGGGLLVGGETLTDFTGNGVTLSSGALTVALTSSGNTGSTSSNSGLEVGSAGLTLLKGCTDGELLKYTDAGGWACASDIDTDTNSAGFTDFGSIVALTTTADSVGIGTSSPANKLSVVGNADVSGNFGIGTTNPGYKLDVAGSANLSSGSTYKINGTDVLSGNTLGSGITASSLTSVGTLTNLGVGNSGSFGGGLLVGGETLTDFTGNGVTLSSGALTVNLTSSGTTGSTSSNSGLEVGSAGLTLLKGCTDGELLKYTDAGGWACAADTDTNTGNISGFTDFGSIVALTTTADNLGVGTSSPTNKLSVVGNADISGNLGVGTTTPGYKLDVAGSANLSSGSTYKINGTDVLSASGLGIGVTASSLTSLGTLGNLTVAGTSALNGGITFDSSTDTISAFTLSGTQDAATNLIVNIGDNGTDFIAGGGLTLAGAFTANSTSALNGAVTLGDASSDTVTSNAGVWSYANSTTIDLVNSARNALNIEGGLLSLDTLNSRVGIGSSSSLAGLDVQTTAWLRGASAGASGLYVNGSGNVGIGTTGPTSPLTLTGATSATGLPVLSVTQRDNSGQPPAAVFTGTGGGTVTIGWAGNIGIDSGKGIYSSGNTIARFEFVSGQPIITSQSESILFRTWNGSYNNRMIIGVDGNVGIGASTPLNKLDVAGSAAFGSVPTSPLPQANSAYFSGNVGIGTTNPTYKLDVAGNLNISSGSTYKIAGTDVLSGNTLGAGITASSLTSVGTLTNLGVGNSGSFGGGLLVGGETLTDFTGNGVTLSSGALTVTLTSSGTTGSTSSNSGLEVGSAGLTLLKGCADNELLKYTDASGWACAADIDTTGANVSGFTDFGSIVALTTTADNLGVGTSSPTNKLSVVGTADISGNLGVGTTTPAFKLDVVGSANLSTGSTYKINGTDVLSGSGLGVGVTASSLTSLGTLGNVTVTGTSALNGGITFDSSTDTISAFTAGGTIDLATNLITNIGNAGTDFIAGGGLTLAGAFTANSTAALNAAVTLGDNAADTVTSNAGVWSFTNATTVDLADNTRGALNFEGGLLALDTLNSRIGIGTTTPTTTLDVVGTGKFSGLLTASSGLSINSETVTDFSGSGIVVTGNALTVNLTSSGTTGSTSSNSGLEVAAAGLTLLKGCTDGELLKYTDAGGWACAVDSDTGNVSGFTDFGSIVALTTTADNLGVGTSSPTNKLSVLGTADISGNLGVGTTTPAFKLDVVGSTNLSSGSTYKINGTDVLSGSGLGVGVTASSLTSLGTLGNVTVTGISALNGGITFDQSSDTISSFTLSGTQFAGNNLIVNIGDTGTDFIAGGGLTLAGAFTANSTSTLNGAVTLGDTSDDTVTSNAGAWSYANSTNVDLVNSARTALNYEGGLFALDTLNSRVGIGSSSSLAGLDVQTTAWLRGAAGGASGLYVNGSGNVGIGITMPQNKLDVSGSVAFGSLPTNPLPQANSAYFSGNVGIGTTNPQANLNVANNSLSTGTGLLVSSTSTSFSSGKLASIDWSPSSATTATGDVLSVNVGANGTVGNIFNVMDGGTSVFSVSQSVITAGLPVNFTAPGDVGIAYDLLFSNQTASNIKSYGPLTIESGESFESNYLTLKTYNSGQIVFDAPGGILLAQAQPWTLTSSQQALNIQNGLLNLDTTNSRVGIGTSNPLAGFDVHNTAWLRGAAGGTSGLYVNGSGSVGIGTTAPKNKLDVAGSVAFGSLPTNPLPQANSAYFSGNVGIGTTNPTTTLDVTGTGKFSGLITASSGVSINSETVTDFSGSGISVTGNALTVALTSSGTTGSTSSNSGLEVGSGGLTLLKGCADGELLKYTDAGGWACATDTDTNTGNISGFTDFGSTVALTTSADNLGVGTSSPMNKLSVTGNADISGNLGIGITIPAHKLDVVGNVNVSSSSTYKVAGTDVLSASGLGVGVTGSSLTKLGTLGNVTVTGTSALNGGITFDSSTDTISAFTLSGTQDAATNLIVNIGDNGTDFVAGGGLTLAGAFTANSTSALNGAVTLGDASSDTVTNNAGIWSYVNSTTIDLVNSARNALNIEGGLLSLDTLNSRVGIGSSSSLAGLDVQTTAWLRGASAGASGLYVNGSGNVGIGITMPLNKLDVAGSVAFGSLPANPLPQANSAYFSGNVGIGTTNPLFGLEVNGTARVNGAVTFGDAVGDTVTSTAGAWTFSNASTFDLANSQLNSLNFESGLLNIDTSGSTVGIGTTVPTAKLHVLQTGSANSFLVQDVASDTSPFVIDASGRVGIGTTTPSDTISLEVVGDTRLGGNISRNAHGSNNLPDQGSISPNGGFEGLTVTTANLPDDWADVNTGATTSTTQVLQGDKSLRMSAVSDEVMSTCYPATGGNVYNFNMYAYVTSTDAVRPRSREYTTLANCIANTSSTTTDAAQCQGPGAGQAWATCTGGNTMQAGTRWMRSGIIVSALTSTHVYVDSLKVTPFALTYGLDLAETYPVAKVDGIKIGEIVSFGTAAKQVDADVNNVTRSSKAYDNLAFGIVSTKPGVVLDDQGASEKVQVALKGRVPVLVSTENGPIKVGDPIVASSKPGVGMKATKAGKILGYAMTEFESTDPEVIDQVIVFVEGSWFDPSLALGSTGDVNGVTSSLASLSPSNTDDIAKDLVKISSDFEKLTLSMNELDSKVDGVEGEVTKLSSENASLTARLSSLEDKLKQLEEGGAVLGIGSTNPQLSGESIASASATLDGADSLIDGTESKLSELTVTGLTRLNNLNVIGDATFGMMQIVGIDPAGGSNIDTITGPLRLQATALNDLDIMNGKVLVKTDGNIITKGQITAKKLNISTQDDTDDNSVGVGKLLKGTKKVVVKTTAITEKSHVFVTPKTLLDYPLVVTVLEPQTSFTVEVKSSEDKDVEFDWFIVN